MRLKPGAVAFIVIVALALIVAGAYQMGLLRPLVKVVAPDRKPAGSVGKEDFSFAKTAETSSTPAKSAGKLDRPIRVAIVLWGGYAGGIMENGGFAPNRDCKFFKDHGIQVELVQIDDFGRVAQRLPRWRRQGRRRHHVGHGGRLLPWSTSPCPT